MTEVGQGYRVGLGKGPDKGLPEAVAALFTCEGPVLSPEGKPEEPERKPEEPGRKRRSQPEAAAAAPVGLRRDWLQGGLKAGGEESGRPELI